MRVLGLDPATSLGHALYDTDKPPSAIVMGSVKFVGDSSFDRVRDIRAKLPKIIRQYAPDFIAIEAPMEFAPSFKKKTKTMFGDEQEVETTINSKTIALLNRIAGAVNMVVLGQNIPCCEVAARTWQSIMPKSLQGPPKVRAKAYCDQLKIVGGNVDSRDAAIIALWAAGHSQQLKLMQRVAS